MPTDLDELIERAVKEIPGRPREQPLKMYGGKNECARWREMGVPEHMIVEVGQIPLKSKN